MDKIVSSVTTSTWPPLLAKQLANQLRYQPTGSSAHFSCHKNDIFILQLVFNMYLKK